MYSWLINDDNNEVLYILISTKMQLSLIHYRPLSGLSTAVGRTCVCVCVFGVRTISFEYRPTRLLTQQYGKLFAPDTMLVFYLRDAFSPLIFRCLSGRTIDWIRKNEEGISTAVAVYTAHNATLICSICSPLFAAR